MNNVTLRQLVNNSDVVGFDNDIAIIKEFFVLNDMEEEGLELIQDLTKSKIGKMKRQQRIVKEWISHLPSYYLYEKYDLALADKLHNLELDFLSHGGTLSKSRMEWAVENIPNIEMPELYFWPLIEYLDNNGVYFKNASPMKEEDKIFIRHM